MRFVRNFCSLQMSLLSRIYRESKKHHVRQRAHCIPLSYQGIPVPNLAKIFKKTTRTIYSWLDLWEAHHFAGLYEQKGRGRRPRLNAFQQAQVQQWAKEFPKNLKKIVALVKERFGVSVSKRILRASGFSWRRIRKKPKGAPDPDEYAQRKGELEELKEQANQGLIDLYFFDERILFGPLPTLCLAEKRRNYSG